MDLRLYRLFEQRLQEALQDRITHVTEGGDADYPAHRESVGYIRGIKYCQDLLREVADEIEGLS